MQFSVVTAISPEGPLRRPRTKPGLLLRSRKTASTLEAGKSDEHCCKSPVARFCPKVMPGPQVWNGTTQISLTPQKSACGKFVSGDDWRGGRATRKQPDGWHLRFRSEVAGKLSHKRMGQESSKISISSPFTSTPCGDIFRFGLRGRQAVKNEPILAALRNCEGDHFQP